MSRSYKQPAGHDYIRGKKGTKFDKRLASKKARKSKGLFSGGSFKKVFDSWDIFDQNWSWFGLDRKDKEEYASDVKEAKRK